MKKQLFVMRHAKAERDPDRWKDFDRPLSDRGRRDANAMGRWLKEQGWIAEQWIASPAVRTRDTARLVATQTDFNGQIEFPQSLYEGSSREYLAQVRLCPASATAVLIIGHNPALEQLVELLSGEYVSLKTAALACLSFREEDWSQSEDDSFQFVDAWSPDSIE